MNRSDGKNDTRIIMLTQNRRSNDARVIREAQSLAAAGYRIAVVCRSEDAERTVEMDRGVRYHAVPHGVIPRWRHTARLVTFHRWVLANDARRILRGPHRLRALSSALELLALPLLAIGLGVSAALRRGGLARRPAQRATRWLAQPVLYLNDHAASCIDEIRALDPDVVHAHDLVTLSAAAYASRHTGARLVYDAHEIETESNNASLHSVTQHYVRRYEAVLIDRTDAVVTVTETISDWLADAYGIERPVVVMNAPSSRPRSADGAPRVRDVLDLPTSAPLVVYVGGVMANRGLEECVRSLRYLPDVQLALVGPRFPDAEQAVIAEASDSGVNGRVHFVDPVPPEAVVEFVSGADCGVIPIQNVCLSYYYCFPNKLLETVAAGVPVAVSDLFELRRFVEETGVGVVMDERNPEAIAAAIGEILAGRDRYAVTPAKIDSILARYGWEVQERRLRALYGRLTPPEGRTAGYPHERDAAVSVAAETDS